MRDPGGPSIHSAQGAATNGMEAIAALAQEKPDLIITDLLMPKMDGFEFIQQVRLNKRWGDIPIVVYTAMPPAEAESRIYALGANDLIRKPCSIDVLVKTIEKHL